MIPHQACMLQAQPHTPVQPSHSRSSTPVHKGESVEFIIPFIFTSFSLLLEKYFCVAQEKSWGKKSRPSETCSPRSLSPHTFPFGLIACYSLWAFEHQISKRQHKRVNMKWAAWFCPPCWGTCVLEVQEREGSLVSPAYIISWGFWCQPFLGPWQQGRDLESIFYQLSWVLCQANVVPGSKRCGA